MKAEISNYVKTLIQRTREGSHVIDGKISQYRVVGYFETILVGLEELEAKAAKWDMIQWALKTESEFVTQTDGKETFITVIDIHRLEQLYKERYHNE